MRRGFGSVLLLGLVACGAPASSVGTASTTGLGNPLLSIERFTERHTEQAVVAEVLDAGSYQYLRLTDDRWLATLHGDHTVGQAVTVVGIGQAEDFHSERLGRDFTVLTFAVVR